MRHAECETVISDRSDAGGELAQRGLTEDRREDAEASRLSVGIDGDEQIRDADFQAIRGAPEDNDFIIDMQQRLANKKQTAHDLITRLQQLA